MYSLKLYKEKAEIAVGWLDSNTVWAASQGDEIKSVI
jgi:hypothetical protein